MRKLLLASTIAVVLAAGCTHKSDQTTVDREEWFTYVETLDERLDHIDAALAQSAEDTARLMETYQPPPPEVVEVERRVEADLSVECGLQTTYIDTSADQVAFFSEALGDSVAVELAQVNWRFLMNEFHTLQALVLAYTTFCSQQFPDETAALRAAWASHQEDWQILNETCLDEFAALGFVC